MKSRKINVEKIFVWYENRDAHFQYLFKPNFRNNFPPPCNCRGWKTFPCILSVLQFTFHVWLHENNMLMFVKRFPLNVMYYRHVIINIIERWWASWNWQFMHVAKTEKTSWLEFLYFRGVFLLNSTVRIARFCVFKKICSNKFENQFSPFKPFFFFLKITCQYVNWKTKNLRGWKASIDIFMTFFLLYLSHKFQLSCAIIHPTVK